MATVSRKRQWSDEKEEKPEHVNSRNTCTTPAALSGDKYSKRELDSIDYSLRITMEMAKTGKAPRRVRVYADGIYDMFHSGHARQLMQAKRALPNTYLIVGVCNDELTHKMKGRTVMNDTERYDALRHCRYVDEVLTDAPWSLDEEFLQKHKIDFVAHDDIPYGAGEQEDIYKWLKDRGQFLVTQRTEGISTTDVIARIIRDYDMYVRRNLQRGYTAKDLNVGFMKEKSLQFKEKGLQLKQKMEKLSDKGHEMLSKWEDKWEEFVGNFLQLFGRDGRINQWITESRLKVVRAISPSPHSSMNQDESSSSKSSSEDGSGPPVNFASSSQGNGGTSPPPPKRKKLHDMEAGSDIGQEIGTKRKKVWENHFPSFESSDF